MIRWNFDNSYARLPAGFYQRIEPVPVKAPRACIFNTRLAKDLWLTTDPALSETDLATLAGNTVPEGAEPLAQAYAGHQFGNFVMLGDGRAIVLGEHCPPDGRRFDIQL
ncbi:MAG TPA: protein adenylyltransferase SelO family protein, partial [Candidatus Rifleibacterium sp.]|nr:protein adenylyltransferase SelO family protein [Candidatus Rifleibacterium sp.]